ncbi:ribosome maturation factor RimP [Enterococcus timonensis]|uniref:ribosome maturation factor RimP n=1 Tax=Enterococcus timonensis TaxID=1852364 RepID=UPI0008DB13A9|nr:ribosome maturation factor RimP [Enterococcus timonensis]
MSSVIETVTELVTPFLVEKNFYLTDLEFVKEGKNWFLRVFIDKEGGIDIEECVEVSEFLSEKLDQMDPDPIPQAYFLEVSSPGAERPLKKTADFEQSIGEFIHVALYEAMDGQKQWDGILQSYSADQLVLSVKQKTRTKDLTIPNKNIAKARLAIQF